jgi:hypothetical protein
VKEESVEMATRTESVLLDLKLKIERKLEENEVICPTCNGTSIHIEGVNLAVISDGVYKLKNFGKYEAIVGCNDCYSGIQKVCKHCKGLYGRRKYQCDCDGARNERGFIEGQKEWDKWRATSKISYSEAVEKCEQFYIETWEKYVSVDDLADEIQLQLDDNEDMTIEDVINLRIYTTYVTQGSFDAESILEGVCEELHEDAYDRSSFILPKLQEKLDEIAKEIESDTTTYFSDKIGINLTKEDVESFGLTFG